MSEAQKLQEARTLVSSNQKEKTKPILWELYKSSNQNIKLDAVLILLVVLDHLTENQKLIEIADEGIRLASNLEKIDIRAYLLANKATLLFSELGSLTYRQRNLMLAAGVFEWIAFSLERDEREFEAIATTRKQLEKEIDELEAEAIRLANSVTNHYLRGHVAIQLAELRFSRFLNQQLDLTSGGRVRSMIANKYFVRRWGLEKYILYSKNDRKKLRESKQECIYFFKKAAAEFEVGRFNSDSAYAFYNLATKFALTFSFFKAKRFLQKARLLAKANNEEMLLARISELEKEIKDKNRHPRNYVEELGLDLP